MTDFKKNYFYDLITNSKNDRELKIRLLQSIIELGTCPKGQDRKCKFLSVISENDKTFDNKPITWYRYTCSLINGLCIPLHHGNLSDLEKNTFRNKAKKIISELIFNLP